MSAPPLPEHVSESEIVVWFKGDKAVPAHLIGELIIAIASLDPTNSIELAELCTGSQKLTFREIAGQTVAGTVAGMLAPTLAAGLFGGNAPVAEPVANMAVNHGMVETQIISSGNVIIIPREQMPAYQRLKAVEESQAESPEQIEDDLRSQPHPDTLGLPAGTTLWTDDLSTLFELPSDNDRRRGERMKGFLQQDAGGPPIFLSSTGTVYKLDLRIVPRGLPDGLLTLYYRFDEGTARAKIVGVSTR